jgi:hypothetical protein
MGLTRHQINPLKRSIETKGQPKSLFVIATEDTYAAKQYFEMEMFHGKNTHVVVLETMDRQSSPSLAATECCSSPDHVAERLDNYKKEYDAQAGDSFWIVIDIDHWPKKALANVAKLSHQKGYGFAASNSCFELWLLLHFADVPRNWIQQGCTSKNLRDKLAERFGGYNKKIKPAWFDESKIQTAIARAKKLDKIPTDRWPQTLGTHVYKLVEAMYQKKN